MPIYKSSAIPFIGFDTEFIRETTYWPLLCLIQLSLENKIILIDPLINNLSLEPLNEIMAMPEIIKICHSGRQDCEIFNHLFGQPPLSLFDTQIAASFLKMGDCIGFQSLVHEILGKKLDKTHQHTNWSARPLSPQQIDYAAQDVADLATLYTYLSDELKEANLWETALEQMKILSDPSIYEVNKEIMPLTIDLKVAYRSAKDDDQRFIQNLALFLSNFLKEHGILIERIPDLKETLLEALQYLVLTSEVEEIEIFKICLEYWNILSAELYREVPYQPTTPLYIRNTNNTNTTPTRRQFYSVILSKVIDKKEQDVLFFFVILL